MRKKWSREAFEKKFGSVEWSQNKNTPEFDRRKWRLAVPP